MRGGAWALLGVALTAWILGTDRPAGLRITQLSVGRGTATVLETPEGGVWLYDIGEEASHRILEHQYLGSSVIYRPE